MGRAGTCKHCTSKYPDPLLLQRGGEKLESMGARKQKSPQLTSDKNCSPGTFTGTISEEQTPMEKTESVWIKEVSTERR